MRPCGAESTPIEILGASELFGTLYVAGFAYFSRHLFYSDKSFYIF